MADIKNDTKYNLFLFCVIVLESLLRSCMRGLSHSFCFLA